MDFATIHLILNVAGMLFSAIELLLKFLGRA